jgi:hypothetical protein
MEVTYQLLLHKIWMQLNLQMLHFTEALKLVERRKRGRKRERKGKKQQQGRIEEKSGRERETLGAGMPLT